MVDPTDSIELPEMGGEGERSKKIAHLSQRRAMPLRDLPALLRPILDLRCHDSICKDQAELARAGILRRRAGGRMLQKSRVRTAGPSSEILDCPSPGLVSSSPQSRLVPEADDVGEEVRNH